MKVICISRDSKDCKLTIGRQYDAYNIETSCEVVNDDGINCYYSFSLFITLEEYRNNKIKELGIV